MGGERGFFGGAEDRLGTSGVGCGAAGPAAPLDSGFRGNDDCVVWVPLCLRGNDGRITLTPTLSLRERGYETRAALPIQGVTLTPTLSLRERGYETRAALPIQGVTLTPALSLRERGHETRSALAIQGVTLTPTLSLRERGYETRSALAIQGVTLTPALSLRERGYETRSALAIQGVTLTPALSLRERGYETRSALAIQGVTLTPALSRRGRGGGGGLFVADDVYYELLGGGDPVVGLEAVGPVLHYVVEELDDGVAVGRLGSDEPRHEEFIYPREDSEEFLGKGRRGVQGHGHQGPLLGGAGVGRVGASIDGVAAWDAFVLGQELGGVL